MASQVLPHEIPQSPICTTPQNAASAKTAATRRFMMRYLKITTIPGGGRLNHRRRDVSKR